MIKSFEITNYLGESIILDLANPYITGLAIESVKGLQPVKSEIKTTEIVTMDGSIYNTARATSRNIVFKFRFLPVETVEETRQRCYKYFPIKHKVTIVVHTDLKDLLTEGYVESNEAELFSNKSGSQVSIICPASYFKSTETSEIEISGLEKSFDFIFSDSVLDYSDDNKIKNITSDPIEFGNIAEKKELTINYEGEVETGFLMNIHFLGPVNNIILYNLRTNSTMTIYVDLIKYFLGYESIESGDNIYISTIKGNKYIYFGRDDVMYNIMSCIDINSDWFQLYRGVNRLGIKTSSGYENIVLNISNNILFEGV